MILTKAPAKSVDIDFLINEKLNSGRLEELLLIVPTNRKVRYLKKELISLSPGKVSAEINLETIGTLASHLYFARGLQGELITDSASAVLLKQAFQESKLKFFSAYNSDIPKGTIDRIRNVISEYKRHGITPALLKNESSLLQGVEKLKAEDIASVYKNYQEKLIELNLKEIGDIYVALNSLPTKDFIEKFRTEYPVANLIIINGFDEFSSPEVDLINTLSQIDGSRLYLNFDYYAFNPLIFSHLDKCYGKLLNKGFKEIQDISPYTFNKFQSLIRGKLFLHKPSEEEKSRFKFTKITADSREKEIELIAKEIKLLLSEKSVEPRKICVVFNLIGNYSRIVRDQFTVYGIPFNLTDRYSLGDAYPVISIINFLEILENDFYYKNIFRALSSGYLTLKGIDASNLLKASVKLKIISGYENWRSTLQDALADYPEAGEDDEEILSDKRSFQKALEAVESINELLSPLNKKMTLRGFSEEIKNLIYALGIPVHLLSAGGDIAEENIKAFETFMAAADELIELLELEFGKNEKFTLNFFLSSLKTAVASSRFNIKERSGYGVQVTTLNEIRGLKFDYLFLAGLCDGDLPTRFSPEIFYSGNFIKGEQVHQNEERYHFYQSLCSWDKELYLSFPSRDARKEFVESNFISALEDLCIVSHKTEKDFEHVVFSKTDALKTVGSVGITETKNLYQSKMNLDWESIEHSLAVDKSRNIIPEIKNEYSGYIGGKLTPSSQRALEGMSRRNYSVTQLETFAKCPYKYFAERILGLEEIKEPTEEIEALELGSLLHSILYKFFTEIKKTELMLSNCTDKEFNSAADLLFEIAVSKVESANFKSALSFYEREKILGINGSRNNSILYKFLLAERNYKGGFIPAYFEFVFGQLKDEEGGEALSMEEFYVRNIKVRGKIDRIDLNKEKQLLKVIDYKLSGKKPTMSDLNSGISLQLPLYLFAAKEMIKAQLYSDFLPASAEIYSLKFNANDFGRKQISNRRFKGNIDDEKGKDLNFFIEMNDKMIEICLDAIELYVDKIKKGEFHLSELEDRESKVCRNCSFRSICRVQELN